MPSVVPGALIILLIAAGPSQLRGNLLRSKQQQAMPDELGDREEGPTNSRFGGRGVIAVVSKDGTT